MRRSSLLSETELRKSVTSIANLPGECDARLRSASDDQGAFHIIAGFRAVVFDAVLPMRAQDDKSGGCRARDR